MKRVLGALAVVVLLCSTGPLRIPPDDPGGYTQQNSCQLFPDDNVWNADIVANRVHVMSSSWLQTIFTVTPLGQTPGLFHVNLGGGNGHHLNVTTAAPTDTFKSGACSDGGEFTGPTPFVRGVSILQVGDPDHHWLDLDQPNCMLYEAYGESIATVSPRAGADSACYNVKWDISSDTLRTDSLSSADEAGLCVTAGLFTLHEVLGVHKIRHALRFQTETPNIDWRHGSWLWPARHASHPGVPANQGGKYKPVLVPFGARLRLRADFVPTGNAAADDGFAAMTQCMMEYGAMLADRGSSQIALSGAADANWGAWPDSFMVWSAQWIPYLEFVDESADMVNKNSGKFRPPPEVIGGGGGGGIIRITP